MQTHVLDSFFVSFILLIMMKVNEIENVKVNSIEIICKKISLQVIFSIKKALKERIIKTKTYRHQKACQQHYLTFKH